MGKRFKTGRHTITSRPPVIMKRNGYAGIHHPELQDRIVDAYLCTSNLSLLQNADLLQPLVRTARLTRGLAAHGFCPRRMDVRHNPFGALARPDAGGAPCPNSGSLAAGRGPGRQVEPSLSSKVQVDLRCKEWPTTYKICTKPSMIISYDDLETIQAERTRMCHAYPAYQRK